MTNTTADRIEALALDLGFKSDPGFSGHLALYNADGSAALVVAPDGDTLFIQLYRLDGPGDDFEMLRSEEQSIRPEWAEYGYVTAERRIRELVDVVLPHAHLI